VHSRYTTCCVVVVVSSRDLFCVSEWLVLSFVLHCVFLYVSKIIWVICVFVSYWLNSACDGLFVLSR